VTRDEGFEDLLGTIGTAGTSRQPSVLKKRTTKKGYLLKGNDEMHVYVSTDGKTAREFIEPFLLRDDSRTVSIGDVGLEQIYTGWYGADRPGVSGLHIINKLAMPIDVIYRNNLIAHVGGAEPGIGYFSGGTSQTYIDNEREGFRIGDRLTFVINMGNGRYLPYATSIISDSVATTVSVGVVIQKVDLAFPDTVEYRVDAPNVLATPYQNPIDAGTPFEMAYGRVGRPLPYQLSYYN
jgi:hypothetical protein